MTARKNRESGKGTFRAASRRRGGGAVLTFFVLLVVTSSPGLGQTRPEPRSTIGSIQTEHTARSAGLSSNSNPDGWHAYPLFGGEMTSIVIDPVDRMTIYVGSRGGGVFKTIDGGLSWQAARDGLTYLPIRSLAVDPAHPEVLYAGTDFHGVWKSTDGGTSWSLASVGLDQGLVAFNLAIDPQNPETVFCGLAGGTAFTVGNVFRSDNGGATWTAANGGMIMGGGDYSNGVLSLALDPDSPQTLYAGTIYEGVFRTTDSAESWQTLNEGVPFRSNDDYLSEVSALAVDHHRGGRPVAVIGGDFFAYDISGGWQQISTGPMPLGFISSQLYVHPTDAQRLYAAGGLMGLSVSRDAGITWQDIHSRCDRVAVDPGAVDSLFCTNQAGGDLVGGVHVSTDGGDSWRESIQGLAAVSIRAVAVDPSDERRIYAGGDGYLYRSQDGGTTWYRGFEDQGYGELSYLGTIRTIAVDPAEPEIVWVAAFPYLMRSTDFGRTLERVDVDATVNDIVFSTAGMYAGTNGNGVFVTTDGGGTWQEGAEGFPTFAERPCPVLSLAVDPHDPRTVWAGTQFGGGAVRSTDGGLTWQVTGLTEHNFVDAIAVNPGDSDDVLAGAGTWDGGIYRSRDGGVTWTESVSGIAFVYDFAYDPHNPGHVYAATDGYGVLRSTDGGDTWQDFSAGIFHPRLLSLDVTQQGSPRLIAGSLGSGLYWTTLAASERVRRSSGRRRP
ncbi:MAG: WD40/YVTN/BNR-like repeat-containing protein [Thermoanaerobaculales bacterium]